MEPRWLEGDEAVQQIITILRDAGRPLTTREVSEETRERLVRCPDATIVFLNRLRQRGVIHGERSKERRGWVWWVD
ncbi:hypothetical protein KAV46_00900 [Candidatus Bathyarchaeota archaeon]|nr:hypothetical protein [Candidatus Bathyarchaeota archaeon]